MGEVKDESVPQAWAWPQGPCPGGGVRSRGDRKHPTLDLGPSAKLQRIFRKVGHSPSISPSALSSRMTSCGGEHAECMWEWVCRHVCVCGCVGVQVWSACM